MEIVEIVIRNTPLMTQSPFDQKIRALAFQWLADQIDLHGDVLPRDLLAEGFHLDHVRVPLLGPQGIWKPKAINQIPLSITTAPDGPYDDSFSSDGLLLYRYRGTDPHHRDNVGLRSAMQHQIPLIYFHGIVKGRYLAIWPVFIVGDDPNALTFTVAADDARAIYPQPAQDQQTFSVAEDASESRRVYITSTVRTRLHQRSFREKVIRAYQQQCSLCRLKHPELLDAAHIIPDSDPGGLPIVSNGIALCKLHHAAFDRHILGIRPDYIIEIRSEILHETDGPMLQHGIKELHAQQIVIPRDKQSRPDPLLLEKRYDRFKEAG